MRSDRNCDVGETFARVLRDQGVAGKIRGDRQRQCHLGKGRRSREYANRDRCAQIGIVTSGKLSRAFCEIRELQEKYAETGKVSVIWVKVDDPANTQIVIDALRSEL